VGFDGESWQDRVKTRVGVQIGGVDDARVNFAELEFGDHSSRAVFIGDEVVFHGLKHAQCLQRAASIVARWDRGAREHDLDTLLGNVFTSSNRRGVVVRDGKDQMIPRETTRWEAESGVMESRGLEGIGERDYIGGSAFEDLLDQHLTPREVELKVKVRVLLFKVLFER